MAEINIIKINEATVCIEAPDNILRELENHFEVFAPNYRFNPKYKSKFWDGKLKIFSQYKGILPIGLIKEVRKFAIGGRYTVECDFDEKFELEFNDFIRFIRIINPILPEGNKPHRYQLAAVWDALVDKRVGIEVPTSGGKTLIAYLIIRFLMTMGKKVLLIVNTTTLVEQCYKDWYDYGWKDVHEKVHRIYSGYDKHFNSPVTICTWQSVYREYEEFEVFDVLMIDEAHGAKSKSLTSIGLCCVNAEWRIGTSGTYPDPQEPEEKCNYFNIVGTLGPIKKYTTYQEMEQRGQVAKLNIMSIILRYPLKFRQEIRDNFKGKYSQELDAIHNNSLRYKFLCDVVNSINKNVMVLFTKKEMHGKPLKKWFEENCPGKRVIYIDGDVKTSERELTRAIAEKTENLIILASYGTFSTGISIKNIHYLLLAAGYKSRIKVLQSIGRGLRRLKGKKEVIKVFDIVDDCACSPTNTEPGFKNYSLKHFETRKKIYEQEGFDWKSIKRNLE